MTKHTKWFFAASFLAILAAEKADAGYIPPVSATGSGNFGHSPSVLIDGLIPTRGTYYASEASVYWGDLTTSFTIDFGSIKTVTSLTASLDNNDTYLIQSSTDGVNFSNLFTFLASDGPVSSGSGGMDTLTTDSTYPLTVAYPGDGTTPEYVGRGFAPTAARYLRLTALSGDGFYSAAELDAFTTAVPEPSSATLCGLAGLLSFAVAKVRRRRQAG